ncbi:MAG: adenylate/guanylate cyclase domain-containing protein [Hyphomicrobiaceae bacterium]
MHVLLRGSLLQKLRLGSGLVLFAFAATHFFNHALGLFGVESMEAFQGWRQQVTRSWPGTVLLYGALTAHIVLGLQRLAMRTTWRMPLWESAQIATGLAIPFLLVPHIVNTRIAHTYFGVFDSYAYELARLWPGRAIPQGALLLLVWVHGCIGLNQWLKFSDVYRRLAPTLLVFAVMLPVAALAGFAAGGRSIAAIIADPDRFNTLRLATNWPDANFDGRLTALRDHAQWIVLLVLACGALLLWASRLRAQSAPTFQITYAAGPTVAATPGVTVLEVSRQHGIPHAAVCGGRARCSTCRVRVEPHAGPLPPPEAAEARTLAAIRAPQDIRLACQLHVTQPMRVTRLLRPGTTNARLATSSEAESEGVERRLAVMFLDLRGFSALTEKQLPYDIVFMLNRFFDAIGEAILSENGWIDKYMGDGLLAVFGRDSDAATGCRQALNAARKIDWALDRVNQDVRAESGEPLDVAMGLHVGPLVIGRIGHSATAAMTVIGPTVNAASRLEGLTRDKNVQVVVSRELAYTAGWSAEGLPVEDVVVRGFSEPIEVLLVKRGRQIYLDPKEVTQQPALR